MIQFVFYLAFYVIPIVFYVFYKVKGVLEDPT